MDSERNRIIKTTAPPRRRRTALAVTLLVVGLLGSPLAMHRADAAAACRSDPILLVNGAIIDVVSTLQTSSSAVRELDYTITVSPGSLLGATRLTVGLGFPEKVTYVYSSQQRWGTVGIAASVITQPGVTPFATTVQASSLLRSSSASGLSNTLVSLTLGGQLML
jgi:hypothetical protein